MLIAIWAREVYVVEIGPRMALPQSGLPSLSIAASNSPGDGIEIKSVFAALAISSWLSAVAAGTAGALAGASAPPDTPAAASASATAENVRLILIIRRRYETVLRI